MHPLWYVLTVFAACCIFAVADFLGLSKLFRSAAKGLVVESLRVFRRFVRELRADVRYSLTKRSTRMRKRRDALLNFGHAALSVPQVRYFWRYPSDRDARGRRALAAFALDALSSGLEKARSRAVNQAARHHPLSAATEEGASLGDVVSEFLRNQRRVIKRPVRPRDVLNRLYEDRHSLIADKWQLPEWCLDAFGIRERFDEKICFRCRLRLKQMVAADLDEHVGRWLKGGGFVPFDNSRFANSLFYSTDIEREVDRMNKKGEEVVRELARQANRKRMEELRRQEMEWERERREYERRELRRVALLEAQKKELQSRLDRATGSLAMHAGTLDYAQRFPTAIPEKLVDRAEQRMDAMHDGIRKYKEAIEHIELEINNTGW